MNESTIKTSGSRIYLFDNIKFLCITLVCISHFAFYNYDLDINMMRFFDFNVAIDMPMFMFISGFFHKNEKIKEKVIFYLFLGIAFEILLAFTSWIFNKTVYFSLLSIADVHWFSFVLAAYILLSYVLRNYNKLSLIIFFAILACFAGFDSTIGDYYALCRIIYYFPFYLLGQFIQSGDILKLRNVPYIKIAAAIILLIWAVLSIGFLEKTFNLHYLFMGRYAYSKVESWGNLAPLLRILCYLISILVCTSVIILMPNKKIPGFTVFGSKTLQVYYWHMTLMYILRYAGVCDILCKTSVGWILWCLLGIGISYLSSTSFFSFPIKQLKNNFMLK